MNRPGPGLHMILIWYWCILSRICCSLCDGVATSFWILQLAVCDLWLSSALLQSSSCEISKVCTAYLVLLYLCCCIPFPCWTGSCLQMQWVWVCCCLVLDPWGNLYHFLFLVGQVLVQLQMNQSLCIMASFYHRIPFMHLLLWLMLLCQIFPGILHSRSSLF